MGAAASVLLVAVVGWLLRAFGVRWSYALSIGFVAALYPPVSLPGWAHPPIGVATLFSLLCLAALVRWGPRAHGVAGAAFGLGWLAGGEVALLLPAIGVHHLARAERPPVNRSVLPFAVAAALTASAALIPGWRGWGTAPPDPLGPALHPGGWTAVVLIALALPGLRRLWRTHRAEFYAVAVLAATFLPIWAIRPRPLAVGDLSVPAAVLAVVCSIGFGALAGAAFDRGVPRPLVLGVEAALLFVLVVRPAVAGAARLLTPPPPPAVSPAGPSLAAPPPAAPESRSRASAPP